MTVCLTETALSLDLSKKQSVEMLAWLVICCTLHKSGIYYLSGEAKFL